MTAEQLMYGGFRTPADKHLLQAGEVECSFDSESGFLRYARINGAECIRAIYGAVRNRNWQTIAPEFSDLHFNIRKDQFQVSFHAKADDGDVGFEWDCQMEGSSGSVIRVVFDGCATRDFLKNRVGLCLLLPLPDLLQRDLRIRHSDGSFQTVSLQGVSAHQPAFDVAGFEFSCIDGSSVDARFAGEIFEMEDQRNWGDASLKIYSTPQSQGWPREIQKGTRVRHEIEIFFRRALPAVVASQPSPAPEVNVGGHRNLLRLRLGYTLSELDSVVSEISRECFQALNPHHLRLDVDLSRSGSMRIDLAALRIKRWLGNVLELRTEALIALRISSDADEVLAELVAALAGVETIATAAIVWLVYASDRPLPAKHQLEYFRELIRTHGFAWEIGGGSDQHFAELNRNLPTDEMTSGGLVAFPTNPQSHAVDRASLFENPPSVPMVVSWLRGNGAQRVLISSATFEPNSGLWDSEAAKPIDLRKRGLIGAAWAVRLIEQLIRAGELVAVTLEHLSQVGAAFSPTGGDSSEMGSVAKQATGPVYPWFHVFADVGEAVSVFECATSVPGDLSAFGFTGRDRGLNCVVANLLDVDQVVHLKGGLSGRIHTRTLDGISALYALEQPLAYREAAYVPALLDPDGSASLRLGPYAVVRVRFL